MNGEEALTWGWLSLLRGLAQAKFKDDSAVAGRGDGPRVGEDSEASPSDRRGSSGVSLSSRDTGIMGWAEVRGEALTEDGRGRARGAEGEQAGDDQRKEAAASAPSLSWWVLGTVLSLETLAMVVQPHRVKKPLVNLRLNTEEEPQTAWLTGAVHGGEAPGEVYACGVGKQPG